ncbi:MAG TPA: glycosyltransferase family 9 protein [Verrucomicrobiae bacterium]|jgi:ADP-heptose:LPS heptosyltransferase
MTERVKRLLILRPDHLGDLVLFSGVLKHFRRRWPDAHISLCVRKFGLELFAHCPYVDELVAYGKLQADVCGQGRLAWMPQVRGSDRLGNVLRKCLSGIVRRKYQNDLAILPILAPSIDHHQCMEGIPARNKIGIGGNSSNQPVEFEKESRRHYSAQMDASHLPWDFSELEATRLFLKFLGIEVQTAELWPEFWTTNKDCRQADDWMPKKDGKIILGMAPGVSSITGKQLPAKWFAEVISLLSFGNFQIVLFGSGADVPLCEAAANAIENSGHGGRVLNLAGKTSVREMIECFRRCDLVLSQETAALHIAAALRKPAAGIVGGGHFGRFYPWGEPKLSRVVNNPMDCYGCNWQCKYETVRCIQEISPPAAAQALNELHAQL